MTDRTNNLVLLLARLLMAAAILPTGLSRALNVSGFALTLAASGIPSPNAVATAAVILQVFGPLALILGVMPRLTGLALAGFIAGFAAVLHPFWTYSGLTAATERSFLLADFGLAGAFLMYAMTGPGAWSWQGLRSGSYLPEPEPIKPAAKKPSVKRAGARAPLRAAA